MMQATLVRVAYNPTVSSGSGSGSAAAKACSRAPASVVRQRGVLMPSTLKLPAVFFLRSLLADATEDCRVVTNDDGAISTNCSCLGVCLLHNIPSTATGMLLYQMSQCCGCISTATPTGQCMSGAETFKFRSLSQKLGR
jgi:hypothetical protein